MATHNTHHAEVTFGDGVAVIRRKGVSRPVVAGILGAESDIATRTSRVWLDRLAHGPKDLCFGGWSVSGAVSTVLTAVAATEGQPCR